MNVGLNIGVYGARGLPSTYSGYETFLAVLLPELVRRGHAVTLYCRKGEVEPVDSYEGVRCVQIPTLHTKSLSTLTHGYLAAAKAATADHDVVLAVNVANAGSALLLRTVGPRVVLNTDGQEWLRGKWGRMGRRIFWWSARISSLSANALVSDSQEMRTIYQDTFGSDSSVIPYCWTGLDPDSDDTNFGRLGVDRHRYFIIAGRLVPENNIAEIAQAYLGDTLQLPLVILGSGMGRSPVAIELAELARRDSRLVLGGHVNNRSSFAALIAGAAAYIHGHSVGGINPSMIEAMGCGARIVALDTPFNREALGDGGDYFSRPSEVVTPLRALLAEGDSAAGRARAAARQRATKHFALTDVADAYEELLRRTAECRRWSRSRILTRWSEERVASVR